MEPNYYAVIPASVRYDNNLTANAKLLYGEISALSNKEGVCWATNTYFANLYNVKERVVTMWINQLIKNNYIESEIIYEKVSKKVNKRILKINGCSKNLQGGYSKKMQKDVAKIVYENNTSINNTSIYSSTPVGDARKGVENLEEKPKEVKPFDPEAWIVSLSESDQPHIRLIAYYFGKYSEHNFPTKEVANDELKKNLQPSMFLVKNYDKKDISKALKFCQEKFSDVNWNLHTVKKQISYVSAKKV